MHRDRRREERCTETEEERKDTQRQKKRGKIHRDRRREERYTETEEERKGTQRQKKRGKIHRDNILSLFLNCYLATMKK